MERLGKWDGNPRKDLLGQLIIELPDPVMDIVNLSQSIQGDEEYWVQNSLKICDLATKRMCRPKND